MKRSWILIILTAVMIAGLTTTGYVSATPSAEFHEKNGELFDDWGVCRTRGFGEDGFYQVSDMTFRPVIAFESLGIEAGQAYNLGKQIADKYPGELQRAEIVFRFVQSKVHYTPDIETFKYEEFAQNADEMIAAINEDGNTYGDCEDSAVLLAVMFKGAGLRSAVAIGRDHTATLVYLPDYKKVNAIFKLDGQSGWVWAEATGKKNPLGWAPKEFTHAKVAAYEISTEKITTERLTTAPSIAVASAVGTGFSYPFPFMGIVGFLWIMSLFRRRRSG